jgi:hypothetical protein
MPLRWSVVKKRGPSLFWMPGEYVGCDCSREDCQIAGNDRGGDLKQIDIPFSYVYSFRMRSNAYPKLRYGGLLLTDADAAFKPVAVGIELYGRSDEQNIIMDRYEFIHIEGRTFPFAAPPTPLTGLPLLFQPASAVRIWISRKDPRPAKLRKLVDGGLGMFVQVWMIGVKQFSAEPSRPAE